MMNKAQRKRTAVKLLAELAEGLEAAGLTTTHQSTPSAEITTTGDSTTMTATDLDNTKDLAAIAEALADDTATEDATDAQPKDWRESPAMKPTKPSFTIEDRNHFIEKVATTTEEIADAIDYDITRQAARTFSTRKLARRAARKANAEVTELIAHLVETTEYFNLTQPDEEMPEGTFIATIQVPGDKEIATLTLGKFRAITHEEDGTHSIAPTTYSMVIAKIKPAAKKATTPRKPAAKKAKVTAEAAATEEVTTEPAN